MSPAAAAEALSATANLLVGAWTVSRWWRHRNAPAEVRRRVTYGSLAVTLGTVILSCGGVEAANVHGDHAAASALASIEVACGRWSYDVRNTGDVDRIVAVDRAWTEDATQDVLVFHELPDGGYEPAPLDAVDLGLSSPARYALAPGQSARADLPGPATVCAGRSPLHPGRCGVVVVHLRVLDGDDVVAEGDRRCELSS